MPDNSRNRRWMVIWILVIGALLVAPAAVWASHQFTDVPDSNTFQ